VLQFLTTQVDPSQEVSGWMESHQEKLDKAVENITSKYVQEAAKKSERLKALVSSVDKDWAQAATLSQMAVRALRSTAGTTTVLVGMRREAYVEDVLEELARPVDINERTESWQKLRDGEF
jgi:aryl-alcohol dehydrogenase-like predicted oxidoreductase